MSTELSCVPAHLRGKKVAKTKLRWAVERDLPKFLEVAGAQLVDEVTADVDVLIVQRERGVPSPEKEALKLNKKGANIQILTVDELRDLMQPSREDIMKVLRKESEDSRKYFDLCQSLFHRVTTDLSGADLSNLVIRDLWLDEINLNDANFTGAQLTQLALGEIAGANFDNASLEGVKFKSADNCSFQKARLKNFGIDNLGGPTGFNHCNFQNAKISGEHSYGHWTGCNFQNADVSDAAIWGEFTDCDFSGANLSGSTFERAHFQSCNFKHANFSNSKLAGAEFTGTDLHGVDFRGVDLTQADFTGDIVDGADFTNATMIDCVLDGVDLAGAKGMGTIKTEARQFSGALAELSILPQGAYVETTMMLQLADNRKVKAEVEAHPGMRRVAAQCDGKVLFKESYKQLADGLVILAEAHPDAILCWDTLTTAYTGQQVTKKELQALAMRAWYQAWGRTPPSDEEIKQDTKKRKKSAADEKRTQREECLALLNNGATGLAEWNQKLIAGQLRKLDPFDGMDLHGMTLPEIRLQTLSLKGGNFECATLTDGRLDFTDLQRARFRNAEMSGMNLRSAKAADADFSGATMKKADFANAILSDARFQNTDLTEASFLDANVQGADFSGANLCDSVWSGARFDEKTVFPQGFRIPEDLMWAGKSADPRGAQDLAAITAGGPIDFETFMVNLKENFDPEKLSKATKMLKADKFQLFSEVSDAAMLGVVKSQNDPDLVYSCRLSSDGSYFCCTQNLNVCGGLRGSICKHLLVLLVGLTKAKQLDPNVIIVWVISSKRQLPKLDKEAASATFIRYKGAEAGDVDWRPTETIPEDYYAF